MRNRVIVCLIIVFAAVLCTSCGTAAGTLIEMEMSDHYDSSEPFINEKLFFVSDDIDRLDFDVSFQMEGENAKLEIADNASGEIFWSEAWSGDTEKTSFRISLNALDKEKEYVVRFIGTKIEYAKIVITSESSLVEERERPLRPAQD